MLDDFEIVVATGTPTLVTWRGVSQFKDPSSILRPFVEELSDKLEGKSVIVDFTELEYMSSSTVPSIIYMCKIFDRKNIDTVVRYNKSSVWQTATFKGLKTLSGSLKRLKVESVTL